MISCTPDVPGAPPERIVTAVGMTDPVQRWRRGLTDRVGMSEPEIAASEAELTAFCTVHAVEPELLVKTWEDYPELVVRRRPTGVAPNRAVESFLIHNGVNVFGDIVCVAGRPEDLAAQGRQFALRPAGAEEPVASQR